MKDLWQNLMILYEFLYISPQNPPHSHTQRPTHMLSQSFVDQFQLALHLSAPQPSGDGCGAVLSTRERRVREERGRVGNPPPRPPRGGPPLLRVRRPGDLLFSRNAPRVRKVILDLPDRAKTSYTYAKVRLGRFGSAKVQKV